MKRIISLLLSLMLCLSLVSPALAMDASSTPNRISRKALDKVRGNAAVLLDSQYEAAIDLINERSSIEHELMVSPVAKNSSRLTYNHRLSSIDDELRNMGVVELSVEDLYTLTGNSYRPGAPSEPDDTNYVHFYGLTSYVGDYEVWSIVASSTGYSQSALPVPFATSGTATLYNSGTYVKNDFNKYIDMDSSVASATFAKKAFERAPLLNYISTFFDLATFFNPTATQKATIEYDANQVFVFSYVAEKSVGYFEFMLTTERKQGTCTLIVNQFLNGKSTVKNLAAGEFELYSPHYADYSYAAEIYKKGMTKTAFYAGNIQIKLDNTVAATISMPVYPELWSIPGI